MIKIDVIYDDPDCDRAHALSKEIHNFLEERHLHNGSTMYSNRSTMPQSIMFGIVSE